jgi:hypothetical protein
MIEEGDPEVRVIKESPTYNEWYNAQLNEERRISFPRFEFFYDRMEVHKGTNDVDLLLTGTTHHISLNGIDHQLVCQFIATCQRIQP